MAGQHNAVAAGNYSSEHIIGKWYLVPDLRLREHRFTVPLDYSSDRSSSSPKISVFAREVVAGFFLFDRIESNRIISFRLVLLMDFKLLNIGNVNGAIVSIFTIIIFFNYFSHFFE